jgi:hypothetical protein
MQENLSPEKMIELVKGDNCYESKNGKLLKPYYISFKGEHYIIQTVHDNYYIKKYYIIVNNKKDKIIEDVIISNCCHPNAWGGEDNDLNINKPPKFSQMCLSENYVGRKLISDTLMTKYCNDCNDIVNSTFCNNWVEHKILKVWSMDEPHHYLYPDYVTTKPSLPEEIIYNE